MAHQRGEGPLFPQGFTLGLCMIGPLALKTSCTLCHREPPWAIEPQYTPTRQALRFFCWLWPGNPFQENMDGMDKTAVSWFQEFVHSVHARTEPPSTLPIIPVEATLPTFPWSCTSPAMTHRHARGLWNGSPWKGNSFRSESGATPSSSGLSKDPATPRCTSDSAFRPYPSPPGLGRSCPQPALTPAQPSGI